MWRKVDCIWQLETTDSVIGPRRRSKALPRVQLAPRKGRGHWWSAASLIHYSFLNPGETITSEKYAQQIDEMRQKLQCLQLALVKRKDPILLHDNAWPHAAQPMLQELSELGYKVLPHLPYSPDPSLTNYHFFKHLNNFLQGKHFCNQNAEKCFPRVCRIPRHRFLCYRNKQTYFSLAKMHQL